jgi:hypothetical protein
MAKPDLFTQKAPWVMSQLMADFGLSAIQAAGILGNIGRECGGLRQMDEIGGSGGLGMCQWTGPRRHLFETFCGAHRLNPRTVEGGYAFLKHELQSTEAAAVHAVKANHTVGGATAAFMKTFERPGVPALVDRTRWANIALAAWEAAHGKKHLAGAAHIANPAAYHKVMAEHHQTLAKIHHRMPHHG